MFFFKPKSIHIDCFTSSENVATYNPIRRAIHFIPEWWKKLDKTYMELDLPSAIEIESPTMKTCVGFVELYRHGLIIPLWSDLALEVINREYRYKFAIRKGNIGNHSPKQHGDSFNNHLHMKITSPWLLKEKTGVKFLYKGCTWTLLNEAPKITVLDGVLNFKHQISTNINCMAAVEPTPYKYTLQAGMPFTQLIPLSDKPVVPHIHVLNEEEYRRMDSAGDHFKFKDAYASKKKAVKELSETE